MACPAPPHSRKGNRVSALRWARLLREAGHRVSIGQDYDGRPCDVLVALHARRSYPAVRTYRRLRPEGPLVVVLTGTDLYRDIRTSRQAQQALQWADRLVLLQPLGLRELMPALRRKARAIIQSAEPLAGPLSKEQRSFQVCVLGHLRYEKDPLRIALATRLLPADSRVRIVHAGEALSAGWARRARAAEKREPRYHWLGEVSRRRARRILARSRLLALSSRMEGGANVISEALAEGVPVLASRIAGSVGLLGAGYPGYFPVGDTAALAQLLHRAETEPTFYGKLLSWCKKLAPLVEPARERASWDALLRDLVSEKRAEHADQDEAMER
ncbi:MAG TPA: selenoneine biosynthesis selenosugar synthase SenB [Gemmataceae bacterium]|nr:selenoneine biosynthesis selenosugar synthase SenB [Gemmataceae bacterium]